MKKLLLLLLTLATACYGYKKENKPVQATTSPQLAKAEALYNHKNDSSFYYFNQVVNSSRDSQEIAYAYNYMGNIQFEAGDFFGSQETLLEALKHLNENKQSDHYSLSSVYTVLGNNCLALKNYDAAMGYYDLALQYATDDNLRLYPANGKALVYQNLHAYSEAITTYSSVIEASVNNRQEYARILSNLARARWLQDRSYPALPELMTALQIRLNEKDDRGMNASYSHLSDYYSDSKPDSALFYAKKMYALAQLINSPDDKLEALQKLINLGPAKDLKQHVQIYQQLNDSLQTARNNAKNQFALIRYEAEKNKADKLILQNDNAEKKVQIIQQRIMLYTILSIVIIGTAISIAWYKKRKQRMQWEANNALRESQLKISQKVHDVVANGLYTLMTRLEHEPDIKKELLLDNLEIMYEKSRDISYEKTETAVGESGQTIAEMLASFAGPETKVLVAGNTNELWYDLKTQVKKELEPVLQELMVNMKKHSQAKNVVVRFTRQGDQAVILYQDDGIGLTPSFKYANGLNNTESRIKSIGGQIIFDKDAKNGLKIRISFPIVQNHNDQ